MRVAVLTRRVSGFTLCRLGCISLLATCLILIQTFLGRSSSVSGNDTCIQKTKAGSNHLQNLAEQATESFDACQAKRNVAFLKVHKAGSSTVMNIFLRFATKRNLNIVLPRKTTGEGFNYLGYKTTLTRDNIVPLPDNETYNILCNHVMYNKPAFHSILPKDTVYIGIVREPVSHFRSTAKYYQLPKFIKPFLQNQSDVVDAFLQQPEYFLSKMDPRDSLFLHNGMSTDFGLPVDIYKDENYVERYIKELNEDFGLVMVLEQFDESLILLRRTLCWNTQDILYIPLNLAYIDDYDGSIHITQSSTQRLQKFNYVDFKLYSYFKAVLEEKVARHGQDFFEELRNFKIVQATVRDFCLDAKTITGNSEHDRAYQANSLEIGASKWSPGFVVTRDECQLMIEDELSIMKRLINKAWTRYRHFLGRQYL